MHVSLIHITHITGTFDDRRNTRGLGQEPSEGFGWQELQ